MGTQNFSQIAFWGSPTSTPSSSFSGAEGIAQAKFTIYATIPPPESLMISDSKTNTPLPYGSVISTTTVALNAQVHSPLPESLGLQVEIEPSFVPFKEKANISLPPGASSTSTTFILKTHPLTNGAYHWQARTFDAKGNTSQWIHPNPNDKSYNPSSKSTSSTATSSSSYDRPNFFIENTSTDLVIQDNTSDYTRDAEPNPCTETTYNPLPCALTPTSTPYRVARSFTISHLSLQWQNNGSGNNCDGYGHYGAAIITASATSKTILTTSTNNIYMGCARNTQGTASLYFSSTTIGKNFSLVFYATDGILQGGSRIHVSHIQIFGKEIPSSSIPATPSSSMRIPVVIIPGVLGSRLEMHSGNSATDSQNMKREEVWPNANAMIGSSSDQYLNNLLLNTDGEPVAGKKIIATDIIRTVTTSIPFVSEKVYSPLIEALKNEGYQEGKTLFVAPYDWRMSATHAAQTIGTVIQKAMHGTPSRKIDIIAHSMGGIVAESYLATASSTSFVDKLILVGTPQLGAPAAFKALQFGSDLGFRIGPLVLLNPHEVKKVVQNMPGIYELLPSQRYTTIEGGYLINNQNGNHATLGFESTTQLMTASSSNERNALLLTQAAQFHALMDTHSADAKNIYNIVGCQNPFTPMQFVLQDDGGVRIVRGNGDGTVPVASAMNYANTYHTYFSLYSENSADHEELVKNAKLLSLIVSLLKNTTSSLTLNTLGISTSTKDCFGSRHQISKDTTLEIDATGPITIGAYDARGNYTGATSTIMNPPQNLPSKKTGSIVERIPESTYESIAKSRFLLLPASGTYRIVIHGQATGTLDIELRSYGDAANITHESTYIHIPITSNTVAQFPLSNTNPAPSLTVSSSNTPSLKATSSRSISPTAILSTSTRNDITPPQINLTISTSSTSTIITYTALDTASGVATTSAILDKHTMKNHTTVIGLAPGIHLVTIKAIDNAGNPRILKRSFAVPPLHHTPGNQSSTLPKDDSSSSPSPHHIVSVPASGNIPPTTIPPTHHCIPRPE